MGRHLRRRQIAAFRVPGAAQQLPAQHHIAVYQSAPANQYNGRMHQQIAEPACASAACGKQDGIYIPRGIAADIGIALATQVRLQFCGKHGPRGKRHIHFTAVR